MTENSKDRQQGLDSDANASRPEKLIFSTGCGPLSDSEIASLKKLAQQTARVASGAASDQPPQF